MVLCTLLRICYVYPIQSPYPSFDNGLGKRYPDTGNERLLGNWNPHAKYPRSCGERAIIPETLKNFTYSFLRTPYNTDPIIDVDRLLFQQTCQYAWLDRIQGVLKDKGIYRWSASDGTLFGIHCFGGMLPWDKDIDLVLRCKDLHYLWDSSPDGPSSEHGATKVLAPGLLMYWNWFWFAKVRGSNTDGTIPKETADLHTIDLFCYEARNPIRRILRAVLRLVKFLFDMNLVVDHSENWAGVIGDYLHTERPLYDVEFGPTTIRTVPTHVADHATQVTFGIGGVAQSQGCRMVNGTVSGKVGIDVHYNEVVLPQYYRLLPI